MKSPRHHTRLEELPAYVTRDGSTIRELMHPDQHGNRHQSLAQAVVPPGGRTLLHCHRHSEELYHFLSGHGEMLLGDERFPVAPGDTVHIAPGTPHRLHNPGPAPLVLLCCCAPPYSHRDTRLLETGGE